MSGAGRARVIGCGACTCISSDVVDVEVDVEVSDVAAARVERGLCARWLRDDAKKTIGKKTRREFVEVDVGCCGYFEG